MATSIPLDSKEIEEAFYGFRAKGITSTGELEVIYSRTWMMENIDQLITRKKEYIEDMTDNGYTNVEIIGILKHEIYKGWSSCFTSVPLKLLEDDAVIISNTISVLSCLELIPCDDKPLIYLNYDRASNDPYIKFRKLEDKTLTELNDEFILDL